MTDTIHEDVSSDDATEVLLKMWNVEDDGNPSSAIAAEAKGEPTEAEAEDGESSEELDLDDEAEPAAVDEPETPEPRTASDDDEVVVKVAGEEQRLKVRDLTRLAGQEKSLTIKGQELASQRKAADDQSLVAMGVLERLYQRAAEEYKPYETVDLFKASRELEPSDFDALRQEMARAAENKRFFESELSGYVQNLRNTRDEQIRSRAGEAQRVIREKIPTWNDHAYDEVRAYAVKEGMHPDQVNSIVDPAALAMIWKAAAYDRAKAKMATKTATTTVVAKVPSKPQTRPSSSAAAQAATKTTQTKAVEKFRRSGGRDDAIEVLMQRWSAED